MHPPDFTEEQKRTADEAWATRNAIFEALPKAAALIKLYGKVPTFHDGEVQTVHLTLNGSSRLTTRIGFPDIFGPGHVFVTFDFIPIDVNLEGFSPQNVIFELWLRPAVAQPDHPAKGIGIEPGDIEIELEPIFGIGGSIIARNISVSWSKRPSGSRKMTL
jgi:hypothetical protein